MWMSIEGKTFEEVAEMINKTMSSRNQSETARIARELLIKLFDKSVWDIP